jgi:hypothetical protein
MEDDSADAEFLTWAKANASPGDHEAWTRALDDTKHQSRRRLIRTEFLHKWISTYVATLIERYGWKKDSVVVQATTEFHVVERTVWNALSPKTHKRDTAREPLSSLLEHNLEIAERSGNQAAAKLLRRLRRRLPTDANTF